MDVVPVGQSVALQGRGLIHQQVIDVNTTVSCSELAGGPGVPTKAAGWRSGCQVL